MELWIREMNEGDIPAVAAIERECFSEPWSEEMYRATLLLPYTRYFVAVEAREIVGMCGVRLIAGEGEITNVAVRTSRRGNGIARAMLLRLMESCEDVESFILEVRAGNAPAIAVYEGLGFVREGVRREFYRLPTEDALLYRLSL